MKKIICLLLVLAVIALAQTGVRVIGQNGTAILGQDYNSGMVTLTNSAAALTTLTVAVKILHCDPISSATTLTITDTAGNLYWPTVPVAANSVFVANYGDPGLKMVGIKWNAGANSALNCQLEGIKQ